MECDGVPEEEDGSDEDLDMCMEKGVFPSAANVNCTMPGISDVPGLDVKTRGVLCNGVKECANGSDENGCEKDDAILGISLSTGLVLAIVMALATIGILSSKKAELLTKPLPLPNSNEEELRKVLLIQHLQIEERREQNQIQFGTDLNAESVKKIRVIIKLQIILTLNN